MLRDVFKRARLAAPSIIFLDEIDALAGELSGQLIISHWLCRISGFVFHTSFIHSFIHLSELVMIKGSPESTSPP